MRNKSNLRDTVCLILVFLMMEMEVMTQNPSVVEVKIGVVLDETDGLNWNSLLSCINMSLSDFYGSRGRHYKTRLVLYPRDSTQHALGVAGAALDLIKNERVEAILGPSTSTQASFVIQLGEKAQVPVISFSATSPALNSIPSSYFFLATHNDKPQVNAISATFQASGWRETVPIYVDNEYGVGIIPYLFDALQAVNTKISYHCAISPSATDDQILEELYKLMTVQTKVFILHMLPSLGTRLFIKAKEVGMMSEGYVWIMTDGMTNLLSSIDCAIFDSTDGLVLGVQPYIPKTKDIENFEVLWRRKFRRENPGIVDAELDIYGLRAYDATTALAMAVEKTGATDFGFDHKKNVTSRSTDLENLGFSRNGEKLAEALSNTRFKGLTGDYLFVNQQLQPSPFHLISINGVRSKEIQLWTPRKFGRRLQPVANSRDDCQYSKFMNLEPIAEPRDFTLLSQEYNSENQTSYKRRLRIAVPRTEGFHEFVNETSLPNYKTKFTGFCIQVFSNVMSKIPNAPHYDFYLYPPDVKSGANYSEMVLQVSKGMYDAAVGDISIIASRSREVDFTLPFMESGSVKMIVATKQRNKNFDFLKPLSWQLWVASISFFIFIGFVVLFLEGGINQEFGKSPLDQIRTSFWFAFSLMVFAHRERISNHCTKLVIIMSCFVILLLTNSYTAALSTYLTLQRYQPAGNTNVHELITNNSKVGYREGSFVYQILQHWGFNHTNLTPYKSAEDCSKLLSNGTIAAAFEETPYINLILQQNCSKYEVIEPKLKTDQLQFQTVGFGFAFPKGSLLAPDVSRQIVNLIEGNNFNTMKKSWSLELKDCSAASNPSESNIIGLESFWVLFSVTGGTSLVAVLIHAAMQTRNAAVATAPTPISDTEDSTGEQGSSDSERGASSSDHGQTTPSGDPNTDHTIPRQSGDSCIELTELANRGEEKPASPKLNHRNN